MSLSCGCDDWGDDADWYWSDDKFVVLATKRSRRCRACKTILKPGTECLELTRFRGPRTDFEERIYGDEVPLASRYLCERCAGIYLSLEELGFCLNPEESMDAQLAEYHRDYAKPPAPGFELKIPTKPI